MTLPQIDAELLLHDIDELGAIGRQGPGINRIAFSPSDLMARAWVEGRMHEAGMRVTVDTAGNSIGHYPGREGLPPIVIGSHTDTVAQGGRYDGALGVLAGIACIRACHEIGYQLRHPVEVINFTGEEATLLGTLGSRAMVGQLPLSDLAKPAYDGRSVASHLRSAGFDPERITQASRANQRIAAYLELHIEQGDRLESEGYPIGLVEGIVGIRRYGVVFEGQANHAGTTQMARRKDALVAAAELTLAVRDLAQAHAMVGTVGTMHIHPNVPNVIPGRVELSCEIRSLNEHALDLVEQKLCQFTLKLGGQWQVLARKEPVASHEGLLEILARACERLGLRYRRMPSGAGHDAMCLAALGPMAMVFVPSAGGISHAPEEYTSPEQCVQGARVLLETLLMLDRNE
ncbi:MAG: Zn-dependent hydrolase [Roseiflexaceae bacterium]